MSSAFAFAPERHVPELSAILREVERRERLDVSELHRILRLHPKDGVAFFTKSELVRGLRFLRARTPEESWRLSEDELLERLRMKPVRTLSGVAPVTVLTRPFPCPGRCIFCPSDVRMPKSYLSEEPGAQRAAEHQFDPYRQTLSRLLAFHQTGHRVDKVELIVLGGTWSFYPESYQLWFVERCFDALNDFGELTANGEAELGPLDTDIDFREIEARIEGRRPGPLYNRLVSEFADSRGVSIERPQASWQRLEAAHRRNERAAARCVGLVLETRPDHLDEAEVWRLRRLGCTKVQLGYQSLDDRVLSLNRRGHSVADTRDAMRRLRAAGFKIHAHWMPNLLGATPESDVEDFRRLFEDRDFRPDELKIYPCSLIESAELMRYYESGDWRPYSHDELLAVLTECLLATPPYCRVTRVIRDIPGTDIVVGNKTTNFRQVAEAELERRGLASREIRSREVRARRVRAGDLALSTVEYDTATGRELFLQYTAADDALAAFLRLQLPASEPTRPELGGCALLREVHVYGAVVSLGERESGRSQHRGLGRTLVARAAQIAASAGYRSLAVISAVGTRPYYRRLGFRDGELYQHLPLPVVAGGPPVRRA